MVYLRMAVVIPVPSGVSWSFCRDSSAVCEEPVDCYNLSKENPGWIWAFQPFKLYTEKFGCSSTVSEAIYTTGRQTTERVHNLAHELTLHWLL